MPYLFRFRELEMDTDAYITFLLEHHDDLNLPYEFAMKLSFMSSPLILGKALIVFDEHNYQVVGAAGFVYGTGANQYEDKHICQFEVAYIQQAYRRTTLFTQGLRVLVEAIKADNPAVTQVQFWTSTGQKELDKLMAKFTVLPCSSKSIVNNMAFYTIPFDELESYCNRLR